MGPTAQGSSRRSQGGTAPTSNGSLRGHPALPMARQAARGGEASSLYSYGASEGWLPPSGCGAGSDAHDAYREVARAATTARALIADERGRARDDYHSSAVAVLRVPPRLSASLRDSMQFGSCQEWASLFLEAGLPAVLFTRITSWPSNNQEDGIPQMMPGEERSDAGLVVAAWRAIGDPSARTTDPFDAGAVPSLLTLRPASRTMLEQPEVG